MDTNTTSTWKQRSGLNDSLLFNLPAKVANIQASGALQKLPHGEIGRLVGVGKPVGHDGKIDKMMGGSLLSLEFHLDNLM